MKNVIDVWLKADQVEEGLHFSRFENSNDDLALVVIEKDGNGNLRVIDQDLNCCPIFEYGLVWDFAPLQVR